MAARSVNAVNDQTTIFLSAVAGAVVGGCVGYLFLTEDGRRLREDLEPKVADLLAELDKARSVVKDATNAIADVRPFAR
jgi:gas vesicle protein